MLWYWHRAQLPYNRIQGMRPMPVSNASFVCYLRWMLAKRPNAKLPRKLNPLTEPLEGADSLLNRHTSNQGEGS